MIKKIFFDYKNSFYRSVLDRKKINEIKEKKIKCTVLNMLRFHT